ncbi:MAG: sulfurtransferase [Gammaproteobacteria bacterium]|nr:sulfurtransferase [Gammaproteobacteria bacterium]
MRKLVLLLLLGWVFPVCSQESVPVMVSTEWLADHVADKDVVLVDMSSEDTQYARFHLPGAIRLPYYTLLLRPKKGEQFSRRISNRALAYNLGVMGISQSDHVVIYDDMGGLEAGRLFWHLEQLGHPRVSVLDGGLVKWILEGRKVSNADAKRSPVNYGPLTRSRDNETTLEDIDSIAKNRSARIVDVRSMEEYTGDEKRKQGGHIAGAAWWEWDQALDFKGGFRLVQNETLRQLLAQKGIEDKTQPLVTYCQSGHRAAHTYLVLRHLGFENVRLYPNSMKEYGSVRGKKLVRGGKPG